MEVVAFEQARKARGLEIARSSKIVKLTDQFWAVPSQQNKGKYAVDPEAGTCMCPDFETHRLPCKHLYAVAFVRHQITDDGEVVTNTLKVTYAQNWPAYNRAQCAEEETVQTLLKELCSGIEQPRYKGNGRPPVPWADVVYSATMKVYTGFSGRRATSRIAECARKGLLDVTPHYNTIFRYLAKPELTPLLKSLICESAMPLRAVESKFGVDATGFNTATYARWFDEKWGKDRRWKEWIKCHAMVGTKTNVVVSVEVTPARRGDSTEFVHLLSSAVEQNFNVKEVSADKAYLSNANLEAVEAVGAVPFIPFKMNSRANGGEAWNRLWHYFHANQREWQNHYHARSNAETTFSMVKQKFGHAVHAKKYSAQVNEILTKILCHNLACLVHEIHELGVEPKFWMPSPEKKP